MVSSARHRGQLARPQLLLGFTWIISPANYCSSFELPLKLVCVHTVPRQQIMVDLDKGVDYRARET